MPESSTRECMRSEIQNSSLAAQNDRQDTIQYWMPAHVRACPTSSGAVILDLKRNRYFGIGTKETRALFALERNWSQANLHAGQLLEPMPLDSALRMANHFVAAGFLSRDIPEPALTTGAIDLSGMLTSVGHELGRSVNVGPIHFVRFLRACAWARKSLRSRTLYSVACEISSAKRELSQSFDPQRAMELVCVFRRLRPFAFTAKDQCLFHALALVKFLSYYHVFPTWVIGVRARPWAAHSWVQEGNLLLDSNPEHVCEYTPILTV
jgi:hypothetical protein